MMEKNQGKVIHSEVTGRMKRIGPLQKEVLDTLCDCGRVWFSGILHRTVVGASFDRPLYTTIREVAAEHLFELGSRISPQGIVELNLVPVVHAIEDGDF